MEGRDRARRKDGDFKNALSYALYPTDSDQKFEVYAPDGTAFDTDRLLPKGFVARSTMIIIKGDDQIVN